MKRVPGRIVRRIIVEETAYATNAYCEECLGEQELRDRPETPGLDDEYDVVVPRENVLDLMRNAIPGVVREEKTGDKVVGYRCSGCDRRLDLDARPEGSAGAD